MPVHPAVLSADDLIEVSMHTVRVMFGRELQAQGPPDPGRMSAMSFVHITGDALLSVQVVTSRAFAEQAAAAVFQLPPADLDDELIADALGELANVVGGAVKALLGVDAALSLPMVTLDASTTHLPGAEVTQCVNLGDNQDTVIVRIWQGRPATGTDTTGKGLCA